MQQRFVSLPGASLAVDTRKSSRVLPESWADHWRRRCKKLPKGEQWQPEIRTLSGRNANFYLWGFVNWYIAAPTDVDCGGKNVGASTVNNLRQPRRDLCTLPLPYFYNRRLSPNYIQLSESCNSPTSKKKNTHSNELQEAPTSTAKHLLEVLGSSSRSKKFEEKQVGVAHSTFQAVWFLRRHP